MRHSTDGETRMCLSFCNIGTLYDDILMRGASVSLLSIITVDPLSSWRQNVHLLVYIYHARITVVTSQNIHVAFICIH